LSGVRCAVLKGLQAPFCIRQNGGLEQLRKRAGGLNVTTKSILRIVLTILMYAGIAVFLFPYFTGRITSGILFMILGAGCTVVCGLLRCYLTEGDCARIPHHGRDW
jgi:hypothetical protein